MKATDKPNVYRSFFLSSTEAMILAKPDGVILSVNPAACSLFQFKEAELQAKGFSHLFAPGNFSVCPLTQKTTNNGNIRDEFVFIKGDGSQFVGDVSVEVFIQNGTEPLSMVVIRDLTDRNYSQRKDGETTAFLNSIVNSTTDLIWSVDTETFGLLYFNRNFYNFILNNRGVQVQKGMRSIEFFPNKKNADLWSSLYRRAAEEGPFVMEYKSMIGPLILELSFNQLKQNDEIYAISIFGKDITEQRRAQERVVKLSRLYDTLSQVNTAIVHSEKREDLFRAICKAVVEHGKFMMAWIGLIDEATHRVVPVCQAGDEKGYLKNIFVSIEDIPHGRGPTGTSIRENSICFVNNFSTDERIKPWQAEEVRCGFKSSAAVPLKQKGKIIGALTMYSGEPDFFDSEQLALMQEMASDISFALDNLVNETERHIAEEALKKSEERFQLSMEATSDGLWDWNVKTHAVYHSPAAYSMLGYTVEDFSDTVQSWKTLLHPDDEEEVARANLDCLEGRTDTILLEYRLRAKIGEWRWMLGRGKCVARDANGKAIRIVGTNVDITERKNSEKRIARSLKQVEMAMEGTLLAVSNIVEQRDPYTAGHERRVGIIAQWIAQELGWEEDRCKNLQRIGLVHDVGKISIPAEVLAKPTKLTTLEFEMIKTHCQKGYDILKDIEFPFPIAETIYQHHERMNGSGYPRGLSGDEILFEARIIGVSDVIEAMSSHRPYRPSKGLEAALEEIEMGRGILYDCSVADAALRLFREKGFRIPQ